MQHAASPLQTRILPLIMPQDSAWSPAPKALMAILHLRTAPDPVLRRKATRVAKVEKSTIKLIDHMFETMYACRGVGLAANQVGVPLRVLVMGIPDEEGENIEEIAVVNPEIIKKMGIRRVEEGCLSIPGYRGQLDRAERIKVKGLDRHGKEIRITAQGLMAQAFEHEIDHLDGILYVDRLREQGTLDTLSEIDTTQPAEIQAA